MKNKGIFSNIFLYFAIVLYVGNRNLWNKRRDINKGCKVSLAILNISWKRNCKYCISKIKSCKNTVKTLFLKSSPDASNSYYLIYIEGFCIFFFVFKFHDLQIQLQIKVTSFDKKLEIYLDIFYIDFKEATCLLKSLLFTIFQQFIKVSKTADHIMSQN